jgi:hypothetical protein
VAACGQAQQALQDLLRRWGELTGKEVKALNERLGKADLPPLIP